MPKWFTESADGYKLSCELCDEYVVMISRQDGIYVCYDCDKKYPRPKDE
jgi:hypothetical protein|tara:strand:- start:538 stop:684 length:147 start_codon:yes stop_codon:yes gene_type:complete